MLTSEIAQKMVIVDVGDRFVIHSDKIDSITAKQYIEFNVFEHSGCGQVVFFDFSKYKTDTALLNGMQVCFKESNPNNRNVPTELVYLFKSED